MNITLKSIKYSEFASHETHCFEATVYVDGKRFCTVQNDGSGGPDNFWPLKTEPGAQVGFYKRVKEIEAELAKEKVDVDGTGKYWVENSLEIEVGNRVNEWLNLKEAKKLLKKVAYRKPGGEIFTCNLAPTEDNLAKVKRQKWWSDDFVMLNTLPIEEVVKIVS